MFGLILIAIVSESPDDLIPNNILRAQTTRKRTASVITALRWNTL